MIRKWFLLLILLSAGLLLAACGAPSERAEVTHEDQAAAAEGDVFKELGPVALRYAIGVPA